MAQTRQGNGRSGPYMAGHDTTRAQDLERQLIPLDNIEPVTTHTDLVKGWLGSGGLSDVYGASNVGKTFLALDLSLHVAAKRDWHGARISASGCVVYVAGEGGAGIRNRIEAVRQNDPSLTGDASARFFLLPVVLDLCAPVDGGALIEALAFLPVPPDLIVIDTLARSLGAGDENSGQSMGAFVASMDRIRAATGAHVMVIHHVGKDGAKGARGHSSLRGAVDTEIELTRDGPTITAQTRKQRDMPGEKTFHYTLRSVLLGEDQDGDPVTSCVVKPTDAPANQPPVVTGQALIALQAFGDALAQHGAIRGGDLFPPNRQCVSLEHWRQFCDRHGLTDGSSGSAARTAFGRAWKALQERQIVRVIDGFAWRCADE